MRDQRELFLALKEVLFTEFRTCDYWYILPLYFSSCFYLHLVRYMDWNLLDSPNSLLRMPEYQFRGAFYCKMKDNLF